LDTELNSASGLWWGSQADGYLRQRMRAACIRCWFVTVSHGFGYKKPCSTRDKWVYNDVLL